MLKKTIETDLVQSLKNKESDKVLVLRSLKAEIQNLEISKQKELTELETISLIRQQIKKSQDAQALFTKGGRSDLAEQNMIEQKILKTYLPPEISDTELETKVKAVLGKHQDITNPGQLTGLVIKELRTETEPSRIAATVKAVLEK